MKQFALLLIFCVLMGAVGVSAADPDITEFETIPDDVYEDEEFEVYVEAEDYDGIDRIKLYVEDDLEDIEYCHGDSPCEVYFESEHSSPGYYEYRIRVYDEDGEYEEDEMLVRVRDEDDDEDDLVIRYFYATPNNPYEDTTFEILVEAQYDSDIDKIRLYADGRLEDTEYCHDDDCEARFDIVENTPGYHTYRAKAYAEDGEYESETMTVFVREYFSQACVQEGETYSVHPASPGCCPGLSPISCSSPDASGNCQPCLGASVCAKCGNGVCGEGENRCNCPQDCQPQPVSYCGDGQCDSGESCSSCPQDCGTCQVQSYCGDGRCSSGEYCSNCPSDCGSCSTAPVRIYTCEERGGECCEYGGTSPIDGASDCPSTCFAACNPAPKDDSGGAGSGASGAVIAAESSLLGIGIVVLVALLAVLIALKERGDL
jgi:hypothetical protein